MQDTTSTIGTEEKREKEARQYLASISALHFPPTLAAFEGAVSYSYRLYASVGFDKLHVIELGYLRKITDDAFTIFETSQQCYGMSSGWIVEIANQWLLDIPRAAQIQRFA